MNTYRVKVRKRTFLWGGENVKVPFEPKSPIYLCFRVDEIGETIRFGILKSSGGSLNEHGTLRPGEGFTIQLNNIVGVYASLDDPQDTYVDCMIIASSSSD